MSNPATQPHQDGENVAHSDAQAAKMRLLVSVGQLRSGLNATTQAMTDVLTSNPTQDGAIEALMLKMGGLNAAVDHLAVLLAASLDICECQEG